MTGFEIVLALWLGLGAIFVLSGFLTGEWVAKYRELRAWIDERRGHAKGRHLPPPQAASRTH